MCKYACKIVTSRTLGHNQVYQLKSTSISNCFGKDREMLYNLTCYGIVEPLYQRNHCALPTSTASHESYNIACLYSQWETLENWLILTGWICKVHLSHFYISFDIFQDSSIWFITYCWISFDNFKYFFPSSFCLAEDLKIWCCIWYISESQTTL